MAYLIGLFATDGFYHPLTCHDVVSLKCKDNKDFLHKVCNRTGFILGKERKDGMISLHYKSSRNDKFAILLSKWLYLNINKQFETHLNPSKSYCRIVALKILADGPLASAYLAGEFHGDGSAFFYFGNGKVAQKGTTSVFCTYVPYSGSKKFIDDFCQTIRNSFDIYDDVNVPKRSKSNVSMIRLTACGYSQLSISVYQF
jgi:hypothetical protein